MSDVIKPEGHFCTCWGTDACMAPIEIQCNWREHVETVEQKRDRTWRLRLMARDAEADALARLVASQRATAAVRERYLAAIKHHEQAVADNISAARGYPCDHFGNRLESTQ